jgi:hypothetical protein
MHREMEILDGGMKRTGAIVIAFDGKNLPTKRHLSDAQNKRIRNVPAANQQIRPQLAVEINLFFISNNQGSQYTNMTAGLLPLALSPQPLPA